MLEIFALFLAPLLVNLITEVFKYWLNSRKK